MLPPLTITPLQSRSFGITSSVGLLLGSIVGLVGLYVVGAKDGRVGLRVGDVVGCIVSVVGSDLVGVLVRMFGSEKQRKM